MSINFKDNNRLNWTIVAEQFNVSHFNFILFIIQGKRYKKRSVNIFTNMQKCV